MKMLLCSYALMLLCFNALTQENNHNGFVVRLNHKLLNFDIIDDQSITHSNFIDLLTDEGVKILSQSEILINISELNCLKLFPNFLTSDSVSIGRQGNKVSVPPFWATFYILKPSNVRTLTFLDELNSLYPLVIYIDPPLKLEFTSAPNDSLYLLQESLNDTVFNSNINVEEAWDIETGKRFVKVGVFDTGIDTLHPDIKVLGGHSYYWDEIVDSTNTNIISAWGRDEAGHGTAVAGIIGAKRNNNIGIAGIAGGDGQTDTSGVSLLDFNLGHDGMNADWVSMAIIDAARSPGSYYPWTDQIGFIVPTDEIYWLNSPGYGITIGNHSYGMNILEEAKKLNTDLKDLPFEDTLDWVWPPYIYDCNLCRESYLFSLQNGVTNVVARGNNFSPGGVDLSSPTGMVPQYYHDSWVISVGASGTDGNRLHFGVNTGMQEQWYSPIGQNLDLIAPGSSESVVSLRSSQLPSNQASGAYRAFNGTSASAPHVAGAAALLASYYNKPCYSNQNLDPADIEYILEHSATPISSIIPNDSVGWGRLNVKSALDMIKYPEFQIIHPEDSYFLKILDSIDTITFYLDTPLNPEGEGPIGSAFPLQLEKTYSVERYKYTVFYNFGDYINGASTQLIDTWVRHSQTNSLMLYKDSSTVLTNGLPTFFIDTFGVEPMCKINNIINDSIIELTGYYYHFIGKYISEADLFLGTSPQDYWYPINPVTDSVNMAFSIYIRDTTVQRYEFGCDSPNILIDTLASINEYSNSFKIFVYPNPSKEFINVVLPPSWNNMVIALIDINGRKVFTDKSVNATLYKIDVQNLNKGLYFMHVLNENGDSNVIKWIKK